jgi:hypothetical protein
MNNNSSSGHGSNVTNLQLLINDVTGFGNRYDPSNGNIKLAALQATQTLGLNAVNAVDIAQPINTKAKAARDTSFKVLGKLSTRVSNAFFAVETDKTARAHVRSLVLLVQSGRVNPKDPIPAPQEPVPAAPAQAAETKVATDNTSHKMYFDNRLDSLFKLIQFIAIYPAYAPNETDLSIAGLSALYNDLKAKNQAANDSETPLKIARIARGNALYTPVTGLVYVGQDTKSYIKSVFGAKSPQYLQVSKLKFRKLKN